MEPVGVERNGAVLTITLQRPERLNAMDIPSMLALRSALQSASTERSVRAVLLTGAGRAFCSGGDVAVMEEYRSRGELPALFHALTAEQEHCVREVIGMPKPVLAALPGVAAGEDSPSRSRRTGGSRARTPCSSRRSRHSERSRTAG